MAGSAPKYPLHQYTRQSPPIDFSETFDEGNVKDKTILITGGASGFGSAFLKQFAALGANVIIGDVNVQLGDQIVRETIKEMQNESLHFVHCDVTDWESQVTLFKEAVRLSTHGGIDIVIANAGVADKPATFDRPIGLDAPNPPPPSLLSIDLNLKGVLYTAHLAMFHLPRNPGSVDASPDAAPASQTRDRQLILIGSMASLSALPGQTLYSVSKHAVLGLFRNLRTTSFTKGMRVNMILPYFMDTPMLGGAARALLAGGGLGKIEDVVSIATRFVADKRIVGRAAVVGPRMRLNQSDEGEWIFDERDNAKGEEVAIWDAHAFDHEDSDAFVRKVVVLMNQFMAFQGWSRWIRDVISAIRYGRSSR